MDKQTKELMEISREVLDVSLKLNKKNQKLEKPGTPYEEAVKMNPYVSKYNTISYSYYQS